MTVIDKILSEWSYRCSDGIVDMNNSDKVVILEKILNELEIDENDPKKVKEIVDQICDKLLVNKIIEDYSYEVL